MTPILCSGRHRFHVGPAFASPGRRNQPISAWEEVFCTFRRRRPPKSRATSRWRWNAPASLCFLAVDRFAVCTLCYRIVGDELRFEPNGLTTWPALGRTRTPGSLRLPVFPCDSGAAHHLQGRPSPSRPGHVTPCSKTAASPVAPGEPHFDENRVPVADLRPNSARFSATRRRPARRRHHRLLPERRHRQFDGGRAAAGSHRPGKAFSIGFEAAGYDEMEYARIAARHFWRRASRILRDPADLVRSIPPWRPPTTNPSAIPRSSRPITAPRRPARPASPAFSPATAATSCSEAIPATPSSGSSVFTKTSPGPAPPPARTAVNGQRVAGQATGDQEGGQLRRTGPGAHARPHADV